MFNMSLISEGRGVTLSSLNGCNCDVRIGWNAHGNVLL